jgi:hypothetical protein
VGNGKGGEIVRITNTAPGETLTFENPWVKLPGESGLMRGSLVVDRTGVYNGDLIVVTTTGGVWRIDGQKKATRIAQTSPVVHLEGVAIVPNFPARFGKLAGRILAGAEEQYNLHTFDASGERETFSLKAANALSIKIEDIDIVNPNENFFGVNYGTNALLGVSSDQLAPLVGDIILTQEVPPSTQSGMWTLRWNFSTNTVQTQAIPIKAGSATVGQWEHVTFAGAGFPEVPIPPPPTVDPPAPPPPPAR